MATPEVIASVTSVTGDTDVTMNIVTLEQFKDATQKYSAGNAHTVLVDGKGQAWSFGKNKFGQLGLGNNDNYDTPQLIQGVPTVVGVACGYDHTVLIDENGQAWSFGKNKFGQLGLGNNDNYDTPQLIQGVTNVVGAACGDYHTILVDENGQAWSFGYNFDGQLGLLYNRRNQNTPQLIQGVPTVVGVACGYDHTVLIDGNEQAWSFGNNANGQLGLGLDNNAKRINAPQTIPGMTNVVGVACGSYHTILVDGNGDVWSFGKNYYGQLGLGNWDDQRIPTQIDGVINVVGAACGNGHTILLQGNGVVLKAGSMREEDRPVEGDFTTYRDYHFFRGEDEEGFTPEDYMAHGIVREWKPPSQYQITHFDEQKTFVRVENPIDVMGVACGKHHTILIDGNGQVWSFGRNDEGQLGLGYYAPDYQETPTPIPDFNLPSVGDRILNMFFGSQAGGNDDIYKRKYLKYKTKYLELRSKY